MRDLTLINIKKIFSSFLIICCSALFSQKKADFILVLDAGHGGHDSGAKGPYANEKDVTLSLVLKVGALIEKNNKDVKVIYTRKTDDFIPLIERANIANTNHANFFISIHCNANTSKSPYGTETYALGTHRNKDNFNVAKRENEVIYLEKDYKTTYEGFDPSTPESMIGLTLMQNVYLENSLKMAKLVEDSFVKDKRFSRGVKQAGFLVLVQTAMPSVLIETGFITNNEEGNYLASDDGQNEIANSIYEAFLKYKKEYDKKSGKKAEVEKPVEKPAEKPVANTQIKVQFLASLVKYDVNAPQLRALKDISIMKTADKYLYFAGNTSLRSESDKTLALAKEAGFKDAFIIDFKEKEKLQGEFYTIEVLVSTKKYREKDSIFKGLKDIIRYKADNSVYYYTYGKTYTFADALNLLDAVQKLGFTDAVIEKKKEESK